MEQLDLGQIVYSYCGKRVYSGSYACGKCANKIFGDIVYNYRENIKREDLKYEVISRPDCYYGRNCRIIIFFCPL